MEDISIKLNIKSCILFEKLTNKSFQDFNIESEEEIFQLIYCSLIANNQIKVTYEVFLTMLENKYFLKNVISNFEKEMAILQQFKGNQEIEEENEDSEESEEKTKVSYEDLSNNLIIEYGVDPHFVLYKLEIFDILGLTKAIERHIRAEMEDKRFWTYLQVSPNINTKKCRTPQAFMPFPWDKDGAKQDLKKKEASIKAFFNKNNKSEEAKE